jgi:hypothetical protein
MTPSTYGPRSRFACVLALTAISLTATGAAASASPATALSAPYAVTLHADPASGWVTTTDAPSGISVTLPGKPAVKKSTQDINGKPASMRVYTRKLSETKGVVRFVVLDSASNAADLDAAMQSLTSTAGTNGTVISSRHFDLDGHPALDGRFKSTINSAPAVGLARFVSAQDHFVGVATIGVADGENTLTRVHKQVLDTLNL